MSNIKNKYSYYTTHEVEILIAKARLYKIKFIANRIVFDSDAMTAEDLIQETITKLLVDERHLAKKVNIIASFVRNMKKVLDNYYIKKIKG